MQISELNRSPRLILIDDGQLKRLGSSGSAKVELPFLAWDEAKTTSDRYLRERALIAALSLFDISVGTSGGGLSFGNKDTFINFESNQFTSDQQHQPQQSQYSSPPRQSSQYGLPSGPRMQTPTQQGQYGLPSGPRSAQHTPQTSREVNNYSRLSNPQQQSPQQLEQQQQQYQPQEQQQASYQYTRPPAVQPNPAFLHSHETTRTNTFVQTPAPLYASNDGYFPGPVNANGYPVDEKEQRGLENPFRNQAAQPPTPMDEIDLEKHKHDGESGWDKHTKLPGRKDANQPYLPFSQRLKHYTWANYTLTMATGGLGTLIAIQPHAFTGLITIGAVFYVLNLLLFTAVTMTMIIRFTKFAGSFKASISHEREGLFLGPFFLSVATIITGTQKYIIEAYDADHPNRTWAVTSMAVAFWAYTFAAFCLASFQYSFLFCSHTYKLTSFMPSWLLPIFPIMLSGTIASVIAKEQPVSSRMPILVAGLGCQGLGFTVAILMYAHYIGRLMQVGYPDREHRGAMFIAVGPPSFTCLALLGMANALPDDFDLQGDGLIDARVLRTLALVVALFLWVLAMWFFMVTLIAVINSWAVYFHLGWWAMVFPNTGFVIATIQIGNALKDETVLYVGNGLTIAVITMWFFVLFKHVQAVYVADIIYPGMDEDIADH
ncbi:malic acid transport protein [Stemphylium lycopersici]|nr:malic acid transport protein [Stemphylium lycopersici]RAR08603.1 malic acid transport protein [Stemphylium lycopersici]